jgi:hypothetical protein
MERGQLDVGCASILGCKQPVGGGQAIGDLLEDVGIALAVLGAVR